MKTLLIVATVVLGALSLAGQTEFLKPEGLAPANGYTHVVVTRPGKLIYVSGQVGMDRSGEMVGKDLKAQTKQVFENLKSALRAAGASFDDVVKINWYIKDFKPTDLATLREIRNQYVNKNKPPASTLAGVSSLFREDCLIEVEAVAVVPEKK